MAEHTGEWSPPKVILGNVPHEIMREAVDIVEKHGFLSPTMGLLIQASSVARLYQEANKAFGQLTAAQNDFINRPDLEENITTGDSPK